MYINKDSTCFSLKLSELCLLLTVSETANKQTLLARTVEVVTKNFIRISIIIASQCLVRFASTTSSAC